MMRAQFSLSPYAFLLVSAACNGSSPTSYGGGGGGGNPPPPGGSVVNAKMQDYSFSPSTLNVKVATTVKWTNNWPSSHTVTSDNGMWDSGTLGPPTGGGGYGGGTAGATYQFTFNTPGTYPYHCMIHPPSTFPGFVGTVVVTQ